MFFMFWVAVIIFIVIPGLSALFFIVETLLGKEPSRNQDKDGGEGTRPR